MTQVLFSGGWGMIPEQNPKQKISWHCPFKLKEFLIFGKTEFIWKFLMWGEER